MGTSRYGVVQCPAALEGATSVEGENDCGRVRAGPEDTAVWDCLGRTPALRIWRVARSAALEHGIDGRRQYASLEEERERTQNH